MINFFENRRKKKFSNRLKYGQDEKPIYTLDELGKALIAGNTEKAQEIVHELVKHKLKGK